MDQTKYKVIGWYAACNVCDAVLTLPDDEDQVWDNTTIKQIATNHQKNTTHENMELRWLYRPLKCKTCNEVSPLFSKDGTWIIPADQWMISHTYGTGHMDFKLSDLNSFV